jgi:TolB-like protein/DNA-binding winged helix-turn-helix (wHTH) protein/Flp pilus assembly protein TadD
MPGQKSLRRVKFGDYLADFDSFELRKHGIRLKVQDQPFQILKLLLDRPGELITREELRLQLWTESTFVDFDAGLNAAVRRLRDVLNDSAENPRYVETLPRHGYRFIAAVEPVAEAQDVSVSPTQILPALPNVEVDKSVAGRFRLFRPARMDAIWRVVTAASVLLLILTSVSIVRWRSKVYAKRSAPQVRPIAVLPFENLSSNASEQYFADAITDALITNLSQVASLRVTSRTSVMQYKGSRPSLPQIGRELHVDSVVEGTIVREGNRVRITAQLIDANSDRHLWAKRYDRDLTNILSMQADVATEITYEIQANLTAQERDRLSQTRAVTPEAYEAYLKARYFYQREDAQGQEKAKEYYLKSIGLDPSFAPAYTGLAENYAYKAFTRTSAPADWLEAETLLKKSLLLDPNSAPTHTLLGMVDWQFYCDTANAEKEFNLALQLNPGDMTARDYYSYYLLETGRDEEAILQKRQVLSRDPVSVRTNAELGLYYLEAKRYDEAIQQLQQTLEMDSTNFRALMRLAFAYQGKQQYDQAIVQMKKAIALEDLPRRYEHLGYVYALAGRKDEALETIELLKRRRDEVAETAVGIALIYLYIGERDLALSWLEKAKPGDEFSLSDPRFDGLRADPRFVAIEARMKAKEANACPAS